VKKVFVYGTLKRGMKLHPVISGSTFLGVDGVRGFHLVDLSGYPAAVPVEVFVERGVLQEDPAIIYGEIYEVDEETLSRLDYIESMYRRASVLTDSGIVVDIYVQDHTWYAQTIPGGEWTRQHDSRVRIGGWS
jgi:gamma-glutamylcyclotransferase (GGCT)/AIG2-like uncharacterized protein YtfP